MLKINFKGIIPQQREYSYSVKENNKTNKIKFIVEKVQDDVDLSLYTPYLKLETPLKDYVDKINTGLVVSSDTNYVYIVWNMPRKATEYQNLNVQLQFQKAEGGTSTDTLVWQSAICTLELQNTIKADAEIADKNPEKIIEIENELANHEGRITALEEDTGGGKWGEIEGNIADQTDLVNLINTNIAPKANKTYVDAQDQALSDDIDDEQQARIDADNDLSDDIDAEETARQNADTALQEQITSLSQRDRFLSGWNCMTGLPTTNPTTPLPYAYKRGDHYTVKFVDYVSQYEEYDTATAYLVGDKCKVTVGGVATYYICIENTQGTFDATAWQVKQLANIKNYRPSGSSYTGVASTVVETEPVAPNDVYQFDGTVWTLFFNTQKTVSMQNVTGLTEALAGKAGKAENNVFTGNNTHSGTETFSNKVYFQGSIYNSYIENYNDRLQFYYGNTLRFQIGNTELNCLLNLNPNSNNYYSLGTSLKQWQEGFINKITDANGSYSSDNVFNVINASEIVDNTLTDAQYATITNGKPTRIKGSLFSIPNLWLVQNYETSSFFNFYYFADEVGIIQLNKTSKVISKESATYQAIKLRSIHSVNGKTVPAYPTNPTSPKALIYDTDNTLKYQDVVVIPMTAPSSTTLTDAEYAELTNGKPHQIDGTFSNIVNPYIAKTNEDGPYFRGFYIGFNNSTQRITLGSWYLNKSTKVFAFGSPSSPTTINLYGIDEIYCAKLNRKQLPVYPSNTGTFVLKCVNGTLTWVEE